VTAFFNPRPVCFKRERAGRGVFGFICLEDSIKTALTPALSRITGRGGSRDRFAFLKKPLAGKPSGLLKLCHSRISNQKKLQALRQIDIRVSKIQV
jgi:hypothetical protein